MHSATLLGHAFSTLHRTLKSVYPLNGKKDEQDCRRPGMLQPDLDTPGLNKLTHEVF